jgi:hypothetical protein
LPGNLPIDKHAAAAVLEDVGEATIVTPEVETSPIGRASWAIRLQRNQV